MASLLNFWNGITWLVLEWIKHPCQHLAFLSRNPRSVDALFAWFWFSSSVVIPKTSQITLSISYSINLCHITGIQSKAAIISRMVLIGNNYCYFVIYMLCVTGHIEFLTELKIQRVLSFKMCVRLCKLLGVHVVWGGNEMENYYCMNVPLNVNMWVWGR